ncbi:unnamed protein product, partial [Laminaria digitata]
GGQGGAALPPVIRRARDCGMCFQNSECMLYHRAAEGGDEESSGLEKGLFDTKVRVGHLSERQLAFFSRWDRTIDLEAKIGEQVRRTMWQESGPDRESRTGKCMSDLVWLGEREEEKNPGSTAGAVPATTATVAGKSATVVGKSATAAATKKSRELAGNGKRFTHVFCRRWAVPEGLLSAAKGGGGGGGGGAGVARARGGSAIVLSGEGKGRPEASERAARGKSEMEADRGGREERPKGAKALSDLSLSVGDMVCVSAQGGT